MAWALPWGTAVAQERREVSTTNFRPGGNISLLASFQQMSWRVREAGAVARAEDWSFAPGLVARYAFHAQVAKKFGYVVGTELELTYEGANVGTDAAPAPCRGSAFRPGPSLLFPSLTGGVVQNYIEDRRFMILIQYGASWFPFMKTCAGEKARDHLLAAIPHNWAALGQFDLFSPAGSAWSVGAGARWLGIRCVGSASVCELGAQKTSVLDRLDIQALGFFFQMGFTWTTGTDSLWR